MNSSLTEDTKAIILLCGVFGKERSVKPLSVTEYTSLVRWLVSKELRPADLMQTETLEQAFRGSGIEKKRLTMLLDRGVQLGFAVEEWQQNGIWVISRSDAVYPMRLKKHLKDKAPPLLFGVGNRALLNLGGLGIVGSRNVDQTGQEFTAKVAKICANNRVPVISGGARGVDQIAMNGAMDQGGLTVGILADNLLKKSVERNFRRAIANDQLLLLSPYHPSARFTVGTAMGRNKLIYAMANFSLVVSAAYKHGGTWAGAEEELKREHARPVFVRVGNDVPDGNTALLERGAIPWPHAVSNEELWQQLTSLAVQSKREQRERNLSLFNMDKDQAKKHKALPKCAEIHRVAAIRMRTRNPIQRLSIRLFCRFY